MKNMMSKIIFICIVLSITVLSGCGKEQNTTVKNNNTNSSQEQTEQNINSDLTKDVKQDPVKQVQKDTIQDMKTEANKNLDINNASSLNNSDPSLNQLLGEIQDLQNLDSKADEREDTQNSDADESILND